MTIPQVLALMSGVQARLAVLAVVVPLLVRGSVWPPTVQHSRAVPHQFRSQTGETFHYK